MRKLDTIRQRPRIRRRLSRFVLGAIGTQAALHLGGEALSPLPAMAVEMPARAYRTGDLPREPATLSEVQVLRAIPERLQRMQQRHESRRAARQISAPSQGRAREAASVDPEVRREPADLSVQSLPPTND